MIPAAALVQAARSLVGVPYRHQGRTQWGVDCIGLIILAAARAGLDLPARAGVKDEANYSRRPDEALQRLTAQICTPLAKLQPGALVLFQFERRYREKLPRHFGIYTDADTVIHANLPHHQVTEHGFRPPWSLWARSFWALPGIDYAV